MRTALAACLLALCVVLFGCTRQYSDTEIKSPLTQDEAFQFAMFGVTSLPFQHETFYVHPTGSMLQVFDHNTYLPTIRAWDRLEVGQVIVYRHPEYPVPVVHQVFKINRNGNAYTRAINSGGRGWDRIEVTEDQYLGTVIVPVPFKPL